MGNEKFENHDRVSEILSAYQEPELIDWKIKKGKAEAYKISRKAMSIGTNVDKWIRADILGEKKPRLNSEEAKTCIKAWKKFKEDYEVDLNELEAGERIFNDETGICGEPDIIWKKYDLVIDIKCSSGIRTKYWLQTEWYARNLGLLSKAVLRLDKNLGVYEYDGELINDKDWEAFNALVIVYRFFKEDN